jgi:hypothetical protein
VPELLLAQYSHEVLTAQGSSSKTTDDLFSSNSANAALGNSLVHTVQKRADKNFKISIVVFLSKNMYI